jgi:hypothetical protein
VVARRVASDISVEQFSRFFAEKVGGDLIKTREVAPPMHVQFGALAVIIFVSCG